MINKIQILCLLLSIGIFQENYSQSNFQNGYVQLSKLDTVFGTIDNNSYYNNSQICSFKRNGSETIVQYKPDQIYGYRFTNGKYYVAKNIGFEDKKVLLFTEYLIHGKLDVYFYQDNSDENHYFAAKDTLPLYELKYREGYKQTEKAEVYFESKEYVGLLNYLTSDCPGMKGEISKLGKPNHENLIHFAKDYHDLTCSDGHCLIYEKKLPRKMKFSADGGVVYLYNATFVNAKTVPSFGFNLMFQQFQRSESYYIGIGLYRTPGMEDFEGFLIKGYQIPLSINYLKPGSGFGPIFSYEFDLNNLIMVQGIRLGVKYQMKNMAFILNSNLKTVIFVKPIGVSLNVGFNIDLR